MPIEKMKCTECEKEFIPGAWECLPGVYHVVVAKRFYMDDAPTVPEIREGVRYINKGASQTQILNIPPERQIKEGEDVRRIPGGSVTFIRGLYETSNPEIQFYLDRKAGLCSEARWREVYLNDDEKVQIRNLDLASREQRLADRENDLLASVKGKQRVGA